MQYNFDKLKMNQEVKIPCIYYLYLHSKIWDMAQGRIISEKDLKKYLFQWKIPEKMRILIIKEMIILGLIEKEKKYYLKINRPEFDLEDLNDYYELLNIF